MLRKWLGLLLVLLLTANTAFAAVNHVQKQYHLDGADLFLDADIVDIKAGALPIYEISQEEWYEYEMPDIFFGGKDYELTYMQGNKGALLPCYITADHDSLLVYSGKFSYETIRGAEIYHHLYALDTEPFLVEKVPDITENEALNLVLELTQKLNIEIALEQAIIHGIRVGAGEDEHVFYYIKVPFAYQGVRIMPTLFVMDSLEYCGDNGDLEVYITADGIEYAFVNGVYWRAGSIIEEINILNQDEAIEAFITYMDSMLHTNDITITEIVLEYVPIPNAGKSRKKTLAPVWTFYVDDYAYAHIDAATGLVID